MSIRDGLVETGLTMEVSRTAEGGFPGGEFVDSWRFGWQLNQGLGGAVRSDGAAHSAIIDRLTDGYYNQAHELSIVDYWDWSEPGALPLGIDPVNSNPDWGVGGDNWSGQSARESNPFFLFRPYVNYYVSAAKSSVRVSELLDPSWLGGYGYYFTTTWNPQSYPPYNDYPYGYVERTGSAATLLGGRVTIASPVAIGSPPCGVSAYAGVFGTGLAGGGLGAGFASGSLLGSWTPDGSPRTFELTAAEVMAAVSTDPEWYFHLTVPDSNSVAGSIQALTVAEVEEEYFWAWDFTNKGFGLELDFLSPTFDAAKYANQYEVVTVKVCDPYFFGDTVSTE